MSEVTRKPKRRKSRRPRHIWFSWFGRESRRQSRFGLQFNDEHIKTFHGRNDINENTKVSNNLLTVDCMGTTRDWFDNERNAQGINKESYKIQTFRKYAKVNKKKSLVNPKQ